MRKSRATLCPFSPMPEFPSTKELLGDVVALKPYTLAGQRDAAEYIHHLVNRWGLGMIRVVEFPETAKLSQGDPKPRNILIECGEGSDEAIVCHTHFDTVPPEDFPPDFDRLPHDLTEDARNPDICLANGSFDNLSHVVSDLIAARRMKLWKGRKIIFASVSGEEQQSQGTHALFHPDFLSGANPILQADGFISGEIPVKSKITDPQTVLIGRPGRVGLHLEVFGEAFHSGALVRDHFDDLASTREAKVKIHLKNIYFPEHQNDPMHLMPESLCQPGTWKSNEPKSMTVASRATLELDVIYTHPGLSQTEIHGIVYREVAKILGDEDFSLTFQPGRELPFTKPYLDHPDHPFVQRGLEISAAIQGEWREPKAGRGTADEPILVHESHKPCIIYSAQGEGEHSRHEKVSIASIERRAEFIERAAAYERPLTRYE